MVDSRLLFRKRQLGISIHGMGSAIYRQFRVETVRRYFRMAAINRWFIRMETINRWFIRMETINWLEFQVYIDKDLDVQWKDGQNRDSKRR